MSFNEWRHRHTNYDSRMSKALTLDEQQQIQLAIATEAMELAVIRKDKTFALSVMQWARNKHIVN